MNKTKLGRIGLAALALLALAILTALRFEGSRELRLATERFETSVGPLDFEAYRPELIADADNAALPILEAVESLKAVDERCLEAIDFLGLQNRRSAADWSDEDWHRARTSVSCWQEALELLHESVGRAGSSFNLDYSAGPAMKIPDLYLLLRAKHLLFAQARMAWREGRPAEAVRSVESLASLSRALEGEAPLLFQLVGHQVEILQYQAIQEGLATGGLGVDYLHRLRSCAKERPRAALLRRALGTEGSMLYLMRPGSPAAPALIADRPWLDRMEYRWLGDGTVARWLDHYSELAQAFPTLTHVEMLKQGLLMPPKDGGSFGMSLGFSEGTLKATTALSDLARLSLDLAITNAETGSFPEELPSGAPKTDVSFTGSSLLYQRSADGSATLSIPGAEELWRTMRPPALDGGFREGEEPLFIWQLSPR